MPLITLKICQQSKKPFPTSIGGAHLPIPHPVHPSPTRFLRPRPDLGAPSLLAGWFRGVTAAAAPLGPITAVQVAVNGAIERAVTGGDRGPTDPERVGVAMAAGAASSVLYSPVDLVVIQQQKLGLDSPGATITRDRQGTRRRGDDAGVLVVRRA